MTQAEIQAIVTAVLAAQQNTPAPASKKQAMLNSKDQSILRTFAKRGYKDVVLMDRNDPTKPFNVRPFGSMKDGKATGWLGQGRVVRKGEKSVRGLFHISQTDPVTTAPAKPKPEIKPVVQPAKPAGGIDPAAIAAAVAKLKQNGASAA